MHSRNLAESPPPPRGTSIPFKLSRAKSDPKATPSLCAPSDIPMLQKVRTQGFTLLELVIVISILSILAGAIAPSMTRQVKRARDTRRFTDMRAICKAIDQFYSDKGRWPVASQDPSVGGWDVSYDGDFIPELREEGYLPEDGKDPKNDETFHYRYFVYNQGAYGCEGETSFYVIGVRNFEDEAFEAKNSGYFRCDERNWGEEFAYVTGAGATN